MTLPLPENRFKRAIADGQKQIGLWSMLPDPYLTEVLGDAGFDWLLLDTEHSPSDLRTVLAQLQAGRASSAAMVVRPAANDPVQIKQFLDLGALTLLIPMVNSADDARAAVSAMRYPPMGLRGIAGMTRASRFARVGDYATRASEELCLLVQVETRSALDEIDAIAAVEGVDGIFIGPGDLAASLGHPGQPAHPEVVPVIEDAIARIAAAGKPAGMLTYDREFALRCFELGARFVAVGADLHILLNGAEKLAKSFQSTRTPKGE